MRHTLLLAALYLAASGLCTTAQATLLPYQYVFDSGWNGGTVALNLPMFDPSYGTLNSVALTVDQRGSLTYAFDNDTPYDTAGAAFMLARYEVQLASPYTQDVYGIVGADDGDGAGLQAGGSDYVTGTVGFDWTNQLSMFWNPPPPLVTGTGTLPFNSLPITETYTVYATGLEWAVLDRQYQQRVTLTYDYTPTGATVPEPGTLLLLAGGLGVGWWRRRRRT